MRSSLTKGSDVSSVNHRFYVVLRQIIQSTFKYFIIATLHHGWAAETLAESLFDKDFYHKAYGVPKEQAYHHYNQIGVQLGNRPNHWLDVSVETTGAETPLLQYARQSAQKLEEAQAKTWDFAVAGAGFAGSAAARCFADAGYSVLVVDKRPYVGGNAHDLYDEHGVLIHLHGPHIFHTNNKGVFEFLSRFTTWRFYEHRVRSVVDVTDGKTYPMPINRTTLNELYGLELKTSEECQAYLDSVKVPCAEIRNSEDVVVSLVGADLCDKFFRKYTAKQWGGLDLKDLSPEVLRRIPTRTNTDDRYFADTYQMMPANGYTAMFRSMLNHPNITTLCGYDYLELRDSLKCGHLVFTGAIDSFFNNQFGPLPYRSLRFEFEHLPDTSRYQEVGTVNYPNNYDFTRITEFKHLTGQAHSGTTLLREYPSDVNAEREPLYPVFSVENNEVLRRYQELAATREDVTFIGRLAEFKYYNMDQVTESAMQKAGEILQQKKAREEI